MLRDLDLAGALDAAARERPDATALVGASGRLTYAELRAPRCCAPLAALRRSRCRAGERVAMSLPNDLDLVVAFLASLRLGAIQVGVHRVLAPPEKRFMLRDCGARVCLADAEIARELDGAARRASRTCEHALSTDAWRARVAASKPFAGGPAVDPHAPAAIAYTSGTTGVPKGVVHSQHNVLLPGRRLRAARLRARRRADRRDAAAHHPQPDGARPAHRARGAQQGGADRPARRAGHRRVDPPRARGDLQRRPDPGPRSADPPGKSIPPRSRA